MNAEMGARHVLSCLIQSIQLGGIVCSATSPVPRGDSGTMTTSYAYLAWDYGSVTTLCVGFDVFVLCFEDFNLLSDKALVRGQVIVVARLHVQEEERVAACRITYITGSIITSVQVLVGDPRGRHRRVGIKKA